ncbi:MAG TPA: tail fiber protein [Thermoanaerobaculia bacterium]|nr:tail fiber protein [Thermoanaerobaculia bacterium]
MFAGNFPPAGWALCDGQLLPISENDVLFTIIGTTYGGDGQETFALPNLQGRVAMHQGNGGIIGETAGVESVTLTVQQIPAHTHPLLGSATNGNTTSPNNALLANSTVITPYAVETPAAQMAANAISPVGGSQPHDNMQPYLVINYIISLYGVYPNPS